MWALFEARGSDCAWSRLSTEVMEQLLRVDHKKWRVNLSERLVFDLWTTLWTSLPGEIGLVTLWLTRDKQLFFRHSEEGHRAVYNGLRCWRETAPTGVRKDDDSWEWSAPVLIDSRAKDMDGEGASALFSVMYDERLEHRACRHCSVTPCIYSSHTA
jgi:hypothetical protein